jgi:hypothetical protein
MPWGVRKEAPSFAGPRHGGRHPSTLAAQDANREMAARSAKLRRLVSRIEIKFTCIGRCETFRPRLNTER